MPAASVIVPARDAAATLEATLDGLAAQRLDSDFEVIVVDDGSVDETYRIVRGHGVVSRVLRAPGAGPSAARNAGARVAAGDVLAFLDADCQPLPGWLAAGLGATGTAHLVQGAVRPPPHARVGPFDRTLRVGHESGLYQTANLFVRREIFDAIGGFESWLRPARGIELGEDVLFGWRARRLGARTVFCASAEVWHAVFPRRAIDYVAERWRLRFFPALARGVPELRDSFFYRRRFLWRRSAAFDLALGGAAVGLAGRRRTATILAAPYLWLLYRHGSRAGRRRLVEVALADLAADAVGAAGLVVGSVRHRSLLL